MRSSLLLFLALAACGGSSKPATEERQPPPADAESPSVPSATLVVDDAGAEPRRELRYRPRLGSTLDVTLTFQTGTVANGKATPEASKTIKGSLYVVLVGADGAVSLRSTFEGTEARVVLHDAHGQILADPDANAQSGGVVGMGVDLQQFPDVPVGRGARWTVRGVQQRDGLVTTTTRVEILDIDGDAVHVKFTSDVETDAESARSHTEGEAGIDLVSLECVVAYAATVDTGGGSGKIYIAELSRD
jgi:hypothetical protein